jgi:hypothetical protein
MAAFEVIALDTATPQLRAPGAADTYTFPRAVEMPLGTANGVLYLNGSKVVTSGSGLTFDGTNFTVGSKTTLRSDGPFLTGANLTSGANPLAIGGGAGNSVVAFFVNNAEQMRLTSTGLGIGTSSPGQKLTVQGGINVTSSATLPAAQGSMLFSYEAPINRIYMGDGTGYSFAFSKRVSSTTTDLVTLTDAGNLGIGTSSPGGKLDVNGSMFTRSLNQFFSATTRYGYQGTTFLATGAGSNTDYLIVADTALKFGVNGSATPVATLDASGNLGLGVTPSGWGSPFNALQISRLGMRGSTATAGLSFNTYYDGASFRYIASGLTATDYYQNSGQHVWNIAPSGTAGNAISFSQVMTLDASGNLGIGTTSPLARLHLNDASGGDVPRIRITNGVTGTGATDGMFVGISNSSQLDVWNFENNSIRFATNNAIRAEITGSGNVVIGEAAIPTNATNAFLYVPGCAGTPTGTPTAYTGRVPIVVDTTNNKLYFYSGGQWRDAGP